MAKRKPKASPGEQQPARPQEGAGRPADRHKKHLLPARVTTAMKEVLADYAKRERRSLAQVVELLLEEILTQKGLWPPPGGED